MEDEFRQSLINFNEIIVAVFKDFCNNCSNAGVAELVDALDSGSSVRKDVRVQISPSAPKKLIYFYLVEQKA